MRIAWKVEDGYVNNGPQHTEVDEDALFECGSTEDALKLIDEEIQSDFESKIRWCHDGHDETKEKVEQLFKAGNEQAAREEEEE